ncbi:hypothetical protein [Variovorax ginsengisoli]|uniref:LysR substrate-binding domain-containing protein n=1 Tax=Variovorax ginsengisoli TaxID=363844 RepID=A0ABT8RW54_9BURK|nr:hypothetical protein [Variovorax ginsengisoli]MDN8611663.1 hypothetical protein [Variovorax ginsengisoli]MDO1530833.1 hypothetical protein [Variovorax ginsengisoli]
MRAAAEERRGRGVVPTDAGRLLATYARRQLDVQATFYAEVDKLRHASRGHVDMVLGEGMLDLFFEPLIADFVRGHPQVTLAVHVASTAGGVDLIAEDRAHIGLETPNEIVERLRASVGHALRQPDVRTRLGAEGRTVLQPFATQAQADAYLAAQIDRYARLLKEIDREPAR